MRCIDRLHICSQIGEPYGFIISQNNQWDDIVFTGVEFVITILDCMELGWLCLEFTEFGPVW